MGRHSTAELDCGDNPREVYVTRPYPVRGQGRRAIARGVRSQSQAL